MAIPEQHDADAPQQPIAAHDLPATDADTRFRGWHLLGVIGAVVVLIAGASALLDVLLRPR